MTEGLDLSMAKTGREWFFHRTGVGDHFDMLMEGQKVEFDEEPSTKGPCATKVRPLQT